jgi:hypothetical protein
MRAGTREYLRSMSYSMLVRRVPGDGDARLYPALADPRTVAMEPIDGEPLRVKATSLAVREVSAGGLRLDAEIRSSGVDVLIGDARVVVSCQCPELVRSEYPLVGSASLAENRSGELVVGQIRHAWLRCVGARSRTGWRAREDVRLGAVVRNSGGGLRELFLDLRLARGASAVEVAEAIFARATLYLAEGSAPGLDRALQAELKHLGGTLLDDLPAPRFIFREMQEFAVVSAATAYPAGLPSRGVQQFAQAARHRPVPGSLIVGSCPRDGTR